MLFSCNPIFQLCPGDPGYSSHTTIRWCFVKTCLELLKLLKESLIELKREGEGSGEESAHGKRGNDAPRLPADSLSVGDQKTVLTAIQFVVILGI